MTSVRMLKATKGFLSLKETLLFADDTSLFSVIHDSNTTALELNSDLAKINRWTFQQKMSFNTDHKKQAQEVNFSRKSKAISHTPLVFNDNNVIQTIFQKHLGIILDTLLSFEKHLETVLCKINKTIGLIRKLQNLLPRTALITLYKAFVRPHLDYGDIIYDQVHNASFHQSLFNTMPVQLLLEQYAVHHGRNYTKNQVLNPYNNVVGIGNYIVSTRSLKMKVRIIYSI